MDLLYLFACGVAWCKNGDPDAGLELLRGLGAGDAAAELSETMLKRSAKASIELLEAGLHCDLIHQEQALYCLEELSEAESSEIPSSYSGELRRPA